VDEYAPNFWHSRRDCRADLIICDKFFADRLRGSVGSLGSKIALSLSRSLEIAPFDTTHTSFYRILRGCHCRSWSIWDTLMAQTTRTRARMCLLGFVCTVIYLGVNHPPKKNYKAWMGVFKPNSRNRKNVHYYQNYSIDSNQTLTVQWPWQSQSPLTQD